MSSGLIPDGGVSCSHEDLPSSAAFANLSRMRMQPIGEDEMLQPRGMELMPIFRVGSNRKEQDLDIDAMQPHEWVRLSECSAEDAAWYAQSGSEKAWSVATLPGVQNGTPHHLLQFVSFVGKKLRSTGSSRRLVVDGMDGLRLSLTGPAPEGGAFCA